MAREFSEPQAQRELQFPCQKKTPQKQPGKGGPSEDLRRRSPDRAKFCANQPAIRGADSKGAFASAQVIARDPLHQSASGNAKRIGCFCLISTVRPKRFFQNLALILLERRLQTCR